jgi:hypothetical protein
VVETNIHYPTDFNLMGHGVRVLTRAMNKITKIAGEVGTKIAQLAVGALNEAAAKAKGVKRV